MRINCFPFVSLYLEKLTSCRVGRRICIAYIWALSKTFQTAQQLDIMEARYGISSSYLAISGVSHFSCSGSFQLTNASFSILSIPQHGSRDYKPVICFGYVCSIISNERVARSWRGLNVTLTCHYDARSLPALELRQRQRSYLCIGARLTGCQPQSGLIPCKM